MTHVVKLRLHQNTDKTHKKQAILECPWNTVPMQSPTEPIMNTELFQFVMHRAAQRTSTLTSS